MSLIALIEKLIAEHGSSAILFKQHLELLRDQISALEKENVALKSENALLKSKENTLKSQLNKAMKGIEPLNQVIEIVKKDDPKGHLDATSEKVLKLLFDKGRELSAEETAAILSMDIRTARYHFDLLLEGKLIIQTTSADKSSWTGESIPTLFELTYLGRKYVIENNPT
jgi:DNA-binding transcriptional ArsR family regulator